MKTASQSLFDGLIEVLMGILEAADAQLAKIFIPVFVRTDDAVNVRRRESKVNRQLISSEAVLLGRETDRASLIWQLFAMILKWVQISSIINKKAWYATPSGNEAPCAEVDYKATSRKRLTNDILEVGAAGGDGRFPVGSARNLAAGQRNSLYFRRKPRSELRGQCQIYKRKWAAPVSRVGKLRIA